MVRVEILDWVIDFDFEKTTKYYESLPYLTNGCTCIDCINYEKACDLIIPEMRELSKLLGINLKKPCDIFYCLDYGDGTCLYWVGYDIIGIIVKGPNIVVQKVSNLSIKSDSKSPIVPVHRAYADGFEISFYSLPSILIDGIEFQRITLDLNGRFLRVVKE